MKPWHSCQARSWPLLQKYLWGWVVYRHLLPVCVALRKTSSYRCTSEPPHAKHLQCPQNSPDGRTSVKALAFTPRMFPASVSVTSQCTWRTFEIDTEAQWSLRHVKTQLVPQSTGSSTRNLPLLPRIVSLNNGRRNGDHLWPNRSAL